VEYLSVWFSPIPQIASFWGWVS